MEQLSPVLSPCDLETKFERKKWQPTQVKEQQQQKQPTYWSIDKYHQTPNCFYVYTFAIFLIKNFAFQLSKTNTQFHKLFKEVSKDEQLKQSKFHLLLSGKKQRNVTVLMWKCNQQVTLVPSREIFCIRASCLSLITGSASTPKSLAKIPRYVTVNSSEEFIWNLCD